MARQVRDRQGSLRKSDGALERHGQLIVGKHGVYLVRGNRKLKSIRLIPWEQFLAEKDACAEVNP